MRRQPLRLCAVVALFVVTSFFASAHHGTAAYNMDHPVTLKGTITEFAWANPHVQIYFDVKDAKGALVHWSCETLSPGKLVRSGWSKDSLKAGDQAIITVVPAKNGSPVGFLTKLMFPDGRELALNEKPQ